MEIRSIENVSMDDGVFLPTFKYAKISNRYTKRYHGSLERLMLLNYLEWYLLDWIVEQSSSDCIVRTDKTERKRFIDFMVRITQKRPEGELIYQDSSVKSALTTLKKVRLLIPFPDGTRGVCWVNPAYHYRNGSEKLRMRMIEYIKQKLEDNGEIVTDLKVVKEEELQEEII